MKKILIVDDDVELCEELADMFGAEGFLVSSASDSSQVDHFIGNGDFDLMILDYKMPGMTGIDVLKKMKSAGLKKEIYLVSGRPFIEKVLKEEQVADMLSGLMHKPINFMDLLDRIKNTPKPFSLPG